MTDSGLEWRWRALNTPWPLTLEVAAAADGVAWSHLRVTAAAAAVRAEVSSDRWQPKAVGDIEVLSIQMVDAFWIAFTDLLTWIRTVDERTSRVHGGKSLGLLSSIPPSAAHTSVETALETFRASGASEARRWAAEALHVLAVPAAFSPAMVVWTDGGPRVWFPFPDKADGRTDTQRGSNGQHRYDGGRDAEVIADELMDATSTFIRSVLGSGPSQGR